MNNQLQKALDLMKEQGGRLGIVYSKITNEWSIGLEWGQETKESPDMYGHAVYGISTTLEGALAEIKILNGT